MTGVDPEEASSPLFDQFVGGREERLRHLDAEQSSGLKVEDDSNLVELQNYGFTSLLTVSESSPAATNSFRKTSW
jgi:hypothetical protein